MATIDVKDAAGATVAIEKPLPPGRAAAAFSRPVVLSTEDLQALTDVLAKVSGDPATQTTLAAVLAKLSADPATQTTLAAILAKLISNPATEAKQDTSNTSLAAILAKLSADPATQTTLAAILAKLIAAPATEAKQDALITANHTDLVAILAKLSADPATQTTLAAILAKIIAAPATEAKQDSAITQVSAVNTVLGLKGDAKSTATDATAITAMSVWKQISASVQAAAASLGTLVTGVAIQSAAYAAVFSNARPADIAGYLAGDVYGTTASAGGAVLIFSNIGPSGKEVIVTSVSLEIDRSAIISGETGYYLALYNASPASNLGDNAAWTLPSGDRSQFLDFIDLGFITLPQAGALTLFAKVDNIGKQITLASANLYAYLIAKTGFTPQSATAFKVTIHTVAP